MWGSHFMVAKCFFAQQGNTLVLAENLTAVISFLTNEVTTIFFPSSGADRCKETWVTTFDSGILWTVNHDWRFCLILSNWTCQNQRWGRRLRSRVLWIPDYDRYKTFIRVTRTNYLLRWAQHQPPTLFFFSSSCNYP